MLVTNANKTAAIQTKGFGVIFKGVVS
jgi:hypothetical protein